MIHVIATITANPGQVAVYLRELEPVLPVIRSESGCIAYEVVRDHSVDHPAQQFLPSDCIVIVERWTNADALRAHLGARHMVELRKRVAGAVKSVRLQVLEPTGDSAQS